MKIIVEKHTSGYNKPLQLFVEKCEFFNQNKQ